MRKHGGWTLAAYLAVCMAVGGCKTGDEPEDDTAGDPLGALDLFGDLIPDREEYVFPESCPPTEDLDACGECCAGVGYDQAAVYGTDCGCQNTVTDDVVCTPSADGDACGACCTDNGYDVYFFIGDDTGGECSCMRSTTEPHAS